MGGVVRRHIDFLIILLIPTPLVLALFFQHHPYFFVHFLNVFSFLFMLFLCNIANVAQRTFKIVQKSRSREYGEVRRDVSRKLQLTLCAIMASER